MNEENYFTKEIQERINEMTESEMNSLLTELAGTQYWTAIMRYNQKRMAMAQNGLYTLDPIAKATEVCRSQGLLMGLSDLQSAIILLVQEARSEKGEKRK
jgi:hypothetical protein